MAEISKITLPSGTTYDIKDTIARDLAKSIHSFTYLVATNWGTVAAGTLIAVGTYVASAGNQPYRCTVAYTVTSTKPNVPPASNFTGTPVDKDPANPENPYDTYKIILGPGRITSTGESKAEWIAVNTSGTTWTWEKLGSLDVDLDDYALDGHRHTFSASGSTSKPGITLTSSSKTFVTAAVKSTTANKNSSAISLSIPAVTPTVSSATVQDEEGHTHNLVNNKITQGGFVPYSGLTLPSMSMSVSGETLSISWSAGGKGTSTNAVTGVTIQNTALTTSNQTVNTGTTSVDGKSVSVTMNSVSISGTIPANQVVTSVTDNMAGSGDKDSVNHVTAAALDAAPTYSISGTTSVNDDPRE